MGDERITEKDPGLPVTLDQQIGLADGVVGGRELLAVNGNEFFNPFLVGLVCGPVQQVFLGHGEHATGAAGRVVDGDVLFVRDGDHQEVHHKADNLAGGEVLSSFLAALLRKTSQ